MQDLGLDADCVLPDGRVIEYSDGGDPQGRGVIFHPGTPASRVLGQWGHDAAAAAGVRLVSINRPGYGGSTPTPPSLRATGLDTAVVAASLGLRDYAVLGISGGGPFAVATAVSDPRAVRALAVVGGVGPWPLLDVPTDASMEERRYLAQFDAGDRAGAVAAFRRMLERDWGGLRALDDERRVDAILDEPGSRLAGDKRYRALWAANMSVVLAGLEGHVIDSLAWGATWDVDPQQVVAPTVVWDSDGVDQYGSWYADRILGSELVTFPGESHLEVCDGHWPEVLAGILRVWA